MVGKAAKPIPVMILGVLIGHKSYPMKKYLFVLLIVFGIVMFMYKDQGKKTMDESSRIGIGEILLFLSLTMDGLTGAVQVSTSVIFFGQILNLSRHPNLLTISSHKLNICTFLIDTNRYK